jgi:uracil-DNA glycosylase family protein
MKKARPAVVPATKSLKVLAAAASGCEACPLYEDTTGTVFGEGPRSARAVLVGEQPGDLEDRAGRPFVGPAGALLDKCLAEAGLDRSALYLTNAVKHFKHHRERKRRLHDKPNQGEMNACRPWLEAELRALAPKVVVALGATAAKQILGKSFSITANRGKWFVGAAAPNVMATWHPSAVLRARAIDRDRAEAMRLQIVEDLKAVKRILDGADVDTAAAADADDAASR